MKTRGQRWSVFDSQWVNDGVGRGFSATSMMRRFWMSPRSNECLGEVAFNPNSAELTTEGAENQIFKLR